MNIKHIIVATVAVAIISTPAFASGSRSGGGGGFSGGGFSQPRDPAKEAYSRGHRAFKKRIACKKCEYPKGFSDAATARKVKQRVRDGDFKLKSKERNFLIHYLSERYGV